jgi:DNA primase
VAVHHHPPDKNFFIYHPDTAISTLAVSVLNTPYEESVRWKSEMSQSFGYQKELFQQDYKNFFKTISPDNKDQLNSYLKTQEDKTMDEVASAINYLKLRKIKRMLLQNQADMEKADAAMMDTLFRTHVLLKQMEMELTQKMGSVIV